jgi:hypothetical protein
MRENRQSGSEGGAILQSSLPLSFIESLRDKVLRVLVVFCMEDNWVTRRRSSTRAFRY